MKPEPKRRIGWRIRYTDPDTGKTKKETLDPALRTKAMREDFCVRKSQQLARRRLAIKEGATRETGLPLKAAIDRYYAAHPTLRDRTVKVYKLTTNKFLSWAEQHRIETVDNVTRGTLMRFREALIQEPRRGTKNGEPRGPHTINREFRSARCVLGYLLDVELFAHVREEDLRRAFKRLSTPNERIDFLKAKDVQRVLEAALRHDQEVFSETRDEHAGLREPGTTTKFAPIAPFVLLLLLTGMRRGEARGLEWKQIDLEALDATGKEVGEIYVTSESKTGRARTVGLEVSPAARRLLVALKLQAGGRGRVFSLTENQITLAFRRLRKVFGAPSNTSCQALRRTCGTYLTNAPGIYGGASVFHSAKQLGHSVEVAEKHYLGRMKGIPRDATTLEAAMQSERQVDQVIAALDATHARRRRTG